MEPSFQALAKRIHPDEVERFIAECDYSIANLNMLDLQFRIVTPSGEIKFARCNLGVTRNNQGIPVRAYGTIQDITEIKIAGQKLNMASQELNRLFNTLDDVLFSRDMISNKLIQISAACEKLYGYKAEDFLTNSTLWRDVQHDDYKNISQEIIEPLNKGEIVVKQYKIVHKTQGAKWVESKVIPTIDKDNKLIRIDGVTRDITESKKLGAGTAAKRTAF